MGTCSPVRRLLVWSVPPGLVCPRYLRKAGRFDTRPESNPTHPPAPTPGIDLDILAKHTSCAPRPADQQQSRIPASCCAAQNVFRRPALEKSAPTRQSRRASTIHCRRGINGSLTLAISSQFQTPRYGIGALLPGSLSPLLTLFPGRPRTSHLIRLGPHTVVLRPILAHIDSFLQPPGRLRAHVNVTNLPPPLSPLPIATVRQLRRQRAFLPAYTAR